MMPSDFSGCSFVEPAERAMIDSFKAMDLLAYATQLKSSGRHICHMEVGQPSTSAPKAVIRAAQEALLNDRIGYTAALGRGNLRSAIARHYWDKYKVSVPAERVIVTTGSSAAFVLSFLGCFEAGDCIALCSSGYPCYRNLMKVTGLECVSVAVNAEFKLTAAVLQREIDRRKVGGLKRLKGLILSSPSNPTGVLLSPQELQELCEVCKRHSLLFLSDEIYHGITYDSHPDATALTYSDSVVVINSFSKYYSMTGWRLGWMVVPPSLIDVMNRLSQNLYLNAPTLSQIAAVEAFSEESQVELQANVAKYAVNRRIVLDTLQSLDLLREAAPADGAFYLYVDLSSAGVTDSAQLCYRVLEEAGVAISPGVDFEDPVSGLGNRRVRFSFSRDTAEVTEGMRRFSDWWLKNMKKPGNHPLTESS